MKRLVYIFLFLYAASAFAQWQLCENGLNGGTVISLIAVNNRIIAGTSRGIYISTNKGENWKLASGEGVGDLKYSQISKLYLSGDKLWAATIIGAYYSTDLGDNWVRAPFDYDQINSIAINGDYVFVSTLYGQYYRSKKGEEPKEVVKGLPETISPVLAADTKYVFAGTQSGLFRSSNNGLNWTAVTIEGSLNRLIAFLKIVNGRLYASLEDKLLVSTDDGNSWTKCDIDIYNDQIFDMSASGQLTYLTTFNGVYRSLNGINSWEYKSAAVRRREAISISAEGNDVYFGTYDGVVHSSDNGDSWKVVNEGLHVIDFSAVYVLDNFVFAGSSFSGVYFSEDNGENWTPTEFYHDYIQGIGGDKNTVYVGAYRHLARWEKGTKKWTDITDEYTDVDAINFAVDGPEVCAQGNYQVFYSSNYGSYWTATNIPEVFSCIVIKDGAFLAGSSYQTLLYRSADKGNSWVPIIIDPNLTQPVKSILVHSNDIYAGTPEGLYISRDDGSTWNRSENGLFNDHILNLAASGEYVFAGSIAGIYASSDNGGSWEFVQKKLPIGEIQVLSASDEYVYAGNEARGIYRAKIKALLGVEEQSPDKESALCVYPNPAEDFIIINFNKTDRISRNTAEIFDAFGSLVALEQIESSSRSRIEVSRLIPGLYCLRCGESKTTFIKK